VLEVRDANALRVRELSVDDDAERAAGALLARDFFQNDRVHRGKGRKELLFALVIGKGVRRLHRSEGG